MSIVSTEFSCRPLFPDVVISTSNLDFNQNVLLTSIILDCPYLSARCQSLQDSHNIRQRQKYTCEYIMYYAVLPVIKEDGYHYLKYRSFHMLCFEIVPVGY